MKYFLIVLALCANLLTNLNGEEVDVDIKSDNFSADKSKNIIIFTGKVSMFKGEDKLYCDKLTVHTKLAEGTGKTVVKQYYAVGKVDMVIKRPTTVMKGRGDEVTYNVDEQVYIIIGNGYLEDVVGQKIIKGEKIYLDEKVGTTKIDGAKNKPVQFKLKIESNS
ncbi:MAG: hypothetical protein HY307_01385 [Arcobacter sp.]|nr:hypothetical protein [Arcobacter sp.]